MNLILARSKSEHGMIKNCLFVVSLFDGMDRDGCLVFIYKDGDVSGWGIFP